jgi:hypothetical protein
VQGWGGPNLLTSYERECRPEALRRTRFAAECAERLAVFKPPPSLDEETAEGAAARALAARHFAEHLPFQYDIPGLNFGARFDDSPIIAAEPRPSPPPSPNAYTPSGLPGGRAPHAWLDDDRSLYDAMGPGFTLLALGECALQVDAFRRTAAALGVPLSVVSLGGAKAGELRQRYEADLVLVRPDQVIAWRSPGPLPDFAAALLRVTGWGRAAAR